MKKFNVVEDNMLNEMAMEFVGGDSDAGERFFEIVKPKLESYANRQYSHLDKEDLAGEFMVEAMKACFEYAERYSETGKNIMGLIYTKCKQRLIDLGRQDDAEKRSSKMVIGYDENGDEIVENREVSLNAPIGEDGESEFGDRVAFDQLTIEEHAERNKNKTIMEKVVSEFVYSTKGRNALILPLIFQSEQQDWSNELLTSRIGEVLLSETGKEPTNASIRKAKSRALESFKKAILDGKLPSAMELEWDF